MIYFTGDKHIPIDIQPLINWLGKNKLSTEDYLIICGDTGFMWNQSEQCKYWVDWFNKQSFTTLYVDGNHERHFYLDSLPIKYFNGNEHSKIHKLADKVIHLMRGQVYEINGKTLFTFGGADSIDKENRIPEVSWWAREMPSNAEYEEGLKNLGLYNWKVDYIITHTCSIRLFEELNKIHRMIPIHTDLNAYFNEIELITSYNYWLFGHFHMDVFIDNRHICLFNNVLSEEDLKDE